MGQSYTYTVRPQKNKIESLVLLRQGEKSQSIEVISAL